MYPSQFEYVTPREEILKLEQKPKRVLVKTRAIVVVIKDGKKYCAWCGKTELTGTKKYCGSACYLSSEVFCNPQSNFGMAFILSRQNYKCNICGFDYSQIMQDLIDRKYHKNKFVVATYLRWNTPKELRPEVDHILPIYQGGCGPGINNHQVICHSCHTRKTKEERIVLEE